DLFHRERHAFGWRSIQDGLTDAPPKKRLQRLQRLIGRAGSPAVYDSQDEFHHIALTKRMNASPDPWCSDLPSKQSRSLSGRSILRQALGYVSLQQLLDPIHRLTAVALAFLRCQVAPLELRREHLLGCHTGLMQSHATIWADGILPQF